MTTPTLPAATTVAALLLIGLLAACNTTEGVGRDVSAAGDAVSDAAGESKTY